MSNSEPKTPIHWALFHSLESDLIALSRFIEIDPNHNGVYSVELTRMLLSIGAEVDSVAKELCLKKDPDSTLRTIKDYERIILQHIPNIHQVGVCFSRYNISLFPWSSWGNYESPIWWQEHNDVKHERSSNYDKANLGNVLNGLAGLFCLCFYLYEEDFAEGLITPDPSILYFDQPFCYGLVIQNRGPSTTSISVE
jgi:hypothetical protein